MKTLSFIALFILTVLLFWLALFSSPETFAVHGRWVVGTFAFFCGVCLLVWLVAAIEGQG